MHRNPKVQESLSDALLLSRQLPDVCYSWWVLASLAILGRLHWLDTAQLRRFILASQVVTSEIVTSEILTSEVVT